MSGLDPPCGVIVTTEFFHAIDFNLLFCLNEVILTLSYKI